MSEPFIPQGIRAVKSKSARKFNNVPKGREPRPMFIDFKDVAGLRKFMTAQGKLMSRKRSGLSAAAQRAVARAVKRARFMGLLLYVGD
jgi:small subunit ribosomal protein S18